jgi:hypothetical protein
MTFSHVLECHRALRTRAGARICTRSQRDGCKQRQACAAAAVRFTTNGYRSFGKQIHRADADCIWHAHARRLQVVRSSSRVSSLIVPMLFASGGSCQGNALQLRGSIRPE